MNRGTIAQFLATIDQGGTNEIFTNGNQDITGLRLNNVLHDLVDTLTGMGYAFKGVVSSTSYEPTEDYPSAYIVTAEGTYAGFDGFVLGANQIGVVYGDGTGMWEGSAFDKGGGGSTDIVDSLESTRTDAALSANQGRALDLKKVDKETGKGLSTNDYTTAEKNKVANLPANTNAELAAQAVTIAQNTQTGDKIAVITIGETEYEIHNGGGSAEGAVKYNEAQSLTDAQKAQARENIGASSGSGGTTDYEELDNKPKINSVELEGNKSLEDLGIASASALAGKQDTISDLDDIRENAEKVPGIELKLSEGLIDVNEEGFFVVDRELNIGFRVNSNGADLVPTQALKRDVTHLLRRYEKRPYPATLQLQQVGTATSEASTYRQGGINVGNLFFQFHNTNDKIDVYDLDDNYTLVQTITTGLTNPSHHCNNVSLGARLNPTDKFPLFYVSTENTQQVIVLHIDDDYACTLLQTINLPSNSGNGWLDIGIDSLCWVASGGNLCKCDCPSIYKGDVTITEYENLGQIDGLLFTYGYQQILCDNGYQVLVWSSATSLILQMFDILKMTLLWSVEMVATDEMESLGFYKDDFIGITLGGKIYKISQ